MEAVGWNPTGPAAAKASADFLAEYKTGEETSGNAGVSKAHAGRAARAAKDGLAAARRAHWFAQYDKVAFLIKTRGGPHHSRDPREYKWLQRVTRQVQGLPSEQGDGRLPLDTEQTADRGSRIHCQHT